MRFERAIDAFQHIQAFHTQLSRFYQRLANEIDESRSTLLLNQMAKHEKELAANVADLIERTPSHILQTWFQYANDDILLKVPDRDDLPSRLTTDDIVELAMGLNSSLSTLYVDMADDADIPDLKETLSNLADMQEQEIHKLSTNIARFMDI